MRLGASFALGVITGLAAWLVLRNDYRVESSAAPPTRAPLVALSQPSFDTPLASTEVVADAPVLASIAGSGPRTASASPTIGFASPGRIVASESARFITIPVRASGRLRSPVQLNVTATSGAARVNEDFVPPVPTLTLTPDQPSGRVLVSILGDAIPENVEDFSLRLSVRNGQATLGTASVMVVLTDAGQSASTAGRASP